MCDYIVSDHWFRDSFLLSYKPFLAVLGNILSTFGHGTANFLRPCICATPYGRTPDGFSSCPSASVASWSFADWLGLLGSNRIFLLQISVVSREKQGQIVPDDGSACVPASPRSGPSQGGAEWRESTGPGPWALGPGPWAVWVFWARWVFARYLHGCVQLFAVS